MATVTASYNWVSGETVTPAKLNTTAAPTVVVADNEVTTAKILDANVTTAKIADANVTNAKLATGIDASKLTTGTLPIARIADDAVTNDKLSLAANAGEIKKALNADNDPPIFACRAWVRFDGTNGSISGGVSGNVSSVTRNAAGNYTVNFSTNMPDVNYAVLTTNGTPDSTANNWVCGVTSQSIGSCNLLLQNSSGVNQDQTIVAVAIFR
jgi:hypothetical protein